MTDNMTTDNMSNEEVIETLKGIVFNGFDRTTPKERQALDLAIKALEERPQGEWITFDELRGWLTAQGFSSGTVEDKIKEFKRYIERSREDE